MPQKQPSHTPRSMYYGWLPQHPEIHDAFLKKHVRGTRDTNDEPTNPHVVTFINAVKGDKVMKQLSNEMFQQIEGYIQDPRWQEKDHQVDDLEHLGRILDSIIVSGPAFWKLRNSKDEIIGEPVGVPILVALDLLSNTTAAYDLFRMDGFNKAMKALLDGWATDTLSKEVSAEVFNDGETGWFCPEGLKMLEGYLKGATFDNTFQPDVGIGKPRRYRTWDSFFTRRFRTDLPHELRPVETKLGVTVINNACESTTLRYDENVQLQDQFWLKGQKYSLYDMLGGDPPETSKIKSLSGYAPSFVGGYVYQAFLSPQDFHRWHSPIKGKVVDITILPGTYYAVLPDEGDDGEDRDKGGMQKGDPHGALIRCQPWLSVSAARCIFIIEAEPNSEIEKVALIGIGMAEVSTVQADDKVKDATPLNPVSVEVGQELGMFHFGGSTHVLIIKLRDPKQKQLVWRDINDKEVKEKQHHWINSIIAQVVNI